MKYVYLALIFVLFSCKENSKNVPAIEEVNEGIVYEEYTGEEPLSRKN